MAQFGSVLGSGPRGRGFESRHSDHQKIRSAYAGRIFLLAFLNKIFVSKKYFFAQLSRKRKMHNIETKVLYEKFLVFLQ